MSSAVGKPASNPCINIYLGKLKARWEEHCREAGKRPGPALRSLLEAELRAVSRPGASSPAAKSAQPAEGLRRGPRARLELRLTASERSRVQELADAEGCSLQQWVVNVVRATLTRQPQFGGREIQILGESNYQLLALGRNLNQIARRLNEGLSESVTLREIQELRDAIKRHTEIASAAIRASVERWAVK